MDVRYSAEQAALADSARAVMAKLGVTAVGDLDDRDRASRLDAAVAEAGWRELRSAADATGAPWSSAVEVGIVAEALAQGCADAALLGPTLAADLRRLAGAAEATGPETVVLTDDLGALAARGTAGVAIDAFGARDALVLVPTEGGDAGLATIAITGGTAGTDLTRPTQAVETAGAIDVDGARIGRDGLDAWMALALSTSTAELVGTMSGVLRLTVDYARERRQYGTPIGAFQAIQHLLADAAAQVEGSRNAALHAAWAVDALPPAEAVAATASAKAYASRAALEVCEIAIQVHGGIGNTWECLAHVHLRRALLSTDVLGGVGPNLERVLAHVGIGAT